MAIEAGCATLDQRNIGSQAHFVDVPSRIEVVESVESNLEIAKPRDCKLGVLDVRMVCDDLDLWVEPLRYFFGDLNARSALVLARVSFHLPVLSTS